MYNFARGPIESVISWTVSNCIGYNNTYGGICYSGSSHNISNCTANDSNTGGFLISTQSSIVFNSSFPTTEFVGYNSSYINTNCYTESLNHNKVANAYKAWTLGGIVVSCADPSGGSDVFWKQMLCESSTYPIFYQETYTLNPNERIYVDVLLRKDTSMAYLPRAQIIAMSADPLVDAAYSPLAEQVMTDSINTTEHYALSYYNDTGIIKKILVRVIGKNATGNIYTKVRRTGNNAFIGDLV